MFKANIKTDGAAFHDAYGDERYDRFAKASETIEILRKIIEDMENEKTEGKCIDFNGNVCGEWKLD